VRCDRFAIVAALICPAMAHKSRRAIRTSGRKFRVFTGMARLPKEDRPKRGGNGFPHGRARDKLAG